MPDNPVRILHVVGRMNRGGAESFIMNVYRNINRNKVQFDFAVNTKEESHFDQEIRFLGGRIYPHPAPNKIGISAYCRLFENTLAMHGRFAGVHSHVHHFSGALLKTVAQSGIKLRIAHSHNTSDGQTNNILRLIYRRYMEWLLSRYSSNFFYCSDEAGLSLFGRKNLADSRACRIRNVIEPARYGEGISVSSLREQLQICLNAIVIGHVGRFDNVKNHKFILSVFANFLADHPGSFLILIGDGPLRTEIQLQAQKLGISSQVLFPGIRDDVPELLKIMNIFLFPSLFEGQPLSLVEAQFAGLPCVVSNTISKETDINIGLFVPLSLQASESDWVKAMKSALNITIPDYSIRHASLCAAGFDLHRVVKFLEDIYCGNA